VADTSAFGGNPIEYGNIDFVELPRKLSLCLRGCATTISEHAITTASVSTV
jgi:hypothetical protein